MNDINKLEKTFRNAAFQSEVRPPEMVWDKIAVELDKKKKRRAIFWFLTGLLAIGLTAGIFVFSDRTEIKNVVTISPEKSDLQNANSAIKEVTDHKDISPDVQLKAGGADIEKNKSGKLQQMTVSDAGNKIAGSNQRFSTADNKGRVVDVQPQFTARSGSNNTSRDQVESNNKPIIIEEPIISRSTETKPDVLTSKSIMAFKNLNSPDQIESLTADPLDIRPYAIKPLKFSKNVECYSFNNKRIVPYLELEAGAGYPIRSMSSNSEPSNLLENRLATEKPWYSYNASVHGGLILRNNMTIATGFNYTEIKDKFDHVTTGTTRIVITVNPVTNQPIDTTIETGKFINSGENRYTMLNIPLSVGYQKKMSNWMVGAEVGGSYNISLKTSGQILYTDQNIHRLEDIDGLYKKSTGLSVNAAVSLHYFLKDNLSVYFKPQYVRSMKDWTQNSASIEARYDILNFNIGLRHTF